MRNKDSCKYRYEIGFSKIDNNTMWDNWKNDHVWKEKNQVICPDEKRRLMGWKYQSEFRHAQTCWDLENKSLLGL